MKKKILVIAGNYQQCRDYCDEKNLNRINDVIYATKSSILGRHPDNTTLVTYGTWYERSEKWIDTLLVEFRKQ